MGLRDDTSDVQFREPIQSKQNVAIEIQAAESAEWTVKDTVVGYAGQKTPAIKVTVKIIDPNVTTAHEDATPQLTFEQTFNLQKHPYWSQKQGAVQFMRPGLLYSLEEALGFEPIFVDGEGNSIAPRITRTGTKVAPNQPGVKRKLNPAFLEAYFTADDKPNLEWAGLKVYADIELEESADAQYGPKNRVTRFKKAPAV